MGAKNTEGRLIFALNRGFQTLGERSSGQMVAEEPAPHYKRSASRQLHESGVFHQMRQILLAGQFPPFLVGRRLVNRRWNYVPNKQ